MASRKKDVSEVTTEALQNTARQFGVSLLNYPTPPLYRH